MSDINNTIVNKIDWQKMDNLVPVVVQCHSTGKVLMLGYMNQEALQQTLATKLVTFYSRSKQRLWQKGETSGNVLKLINIAVDCDGDSLLALAEASGPTCHIGSASCFSQGFVNHYEVLANLEKTIDKRKQQKPQSSYIANLFSQGLARIAQKVGEEGVEVVIAAMKNDHEELKNESADLIFHLLVLLAEKELSLQDVLQILDRRETQRIVGKSYVTPVSNTKDSCKKS